MSVLVNYVAPRCITQFTKSEAIHDFGNLPLGSRSHGMTLTLCSVAAVIGKSSGETLTFVYGNP